MSNLRGFNRWYGCESHPRLHFFPCISAMFLEIEPKSGYAGIETSTLARALTKRSQTRPRSAALFAPSTIRVFAVMCIGNLLLGFFSPGDGEFFSLQSPQPRRASGLRAGMSVDYRSQVCHAFQWRHRMLDKQRRTIASGLNPSFHPEIV